MAPGDIANLLPAPAAAEPEAFHTGSSGAPANAELVADSAPVTELTPLDASAETHPGVSPTTEIAQEPQYQTPTPRIAPGIGDALLASTVLRTVDGQPWSPPASVLAAKTTQAALLTESAAAPGAPITEPTQPPAPEAAAIDQGAAPKPHDAPVKELVAAAPALPSLAMLEFNPAALGHSENVRAAPSERRAGAASLSRTRKPAPAPAIASAPAPQAVLIGAHAESEFEPYQVQALAPARRATLPPQAPVLLAAAEPVAQAAIPSSLETASVASSAESPVAEPQPPAPIAEVAPLVATTSPEAAALIVAEAPVTPDAAEAQIAAVIAPQAAPASPIEATPNPAQPVETQPAITQASVEPVAPPVTQEATAISPPAVEPAPAQEAPAAPVTLAAVQTPAVAKPTLSAAPSPAPSPNADAPNALLQQAAYTGVTPRIDWRDVINPADKTRLKNLLTTRAAAIKQAETAIDSGDKAAVAAAPATSNILYSKPLAAQEADLLGGYRCRITRLGGAAPQLVAYRFTTCEINQWPDGSLVVEKTSGSSRFIGRLWREADSSFVYLGTTMPDEGTPWAYDEKPNENQVGRLYRISGNRLRLELPRPHTGSALDIVEFVRLK